MKKLFQKIFLITAALIVAGGCGEDSSSVDDIPPQAPVIVLRSSDNAYPQQGVRPEPVANPNNYYMRIEWQRNPETDVAGYRVYRGL